MKNIIQREIKFRFWDKKYKIMRDDNFANPINGDAQMLFLDVAGTIWLKGNKQELTDVSDRFIALQFTGLKDKNGKEIYKGDIVEYTRKDLDKIGVLYQPTPKKVRFLIQWGEKGFKDNKLGFGELSYQKGKVIGNIYKNSELFK